MDFNISNISYRNRRFYYNLCGFIRLLNKHKLKPYKAVLYFALYICHGFNSLSTLGSKSLGFVPFRPSLIFSISFCFYLISLLNIFIAYLKNILTVYYLVCIYTRNYGKYFRSDFNAFHRFAYLQS